MPRPSLGWDDKKEDLFRLYVEEEKSMDQIRAYIKEHYDFEASRRAFQYNFKKWGFPGRRNPMPNDDELLDRIKELWEKNFSQKEILSSLEDEGFSISDRVLSRIRSQNNWMIRGTHGFRPTFSKRRAGTENNNGDDEEVHEQLLSDLNGTAEAQNVGQPIQTFPPQSEPLDLEEQRMREQRRQEVETNSAELYANKKRKRRSRGWPGLPADPPAPPRFPSETTIDESKAFLHLNNDVYVELRKTFEATCKQDGVDRKVSAGPERWNAVKEKTIAQIPHLHKQFFGPFDGVSRDNKVLGLDVICMDVTKLMRTAGRRMTLIQAKQVLGTNPQESRLMRSQFYDLLVANNFTSKSETDEGHFQQLKQEWMNGSDLVQSLLLREDPSSSEGQKTRQAINVIGRDVVRRLRGDIVRQDPSLKLQSQWGPGPGPAPPPRKPADPKPARKPKPKLQTFSDLPPPYTSSPYKSKPKPSPKPKPKPKPKSTPRNKKQRVEPDAAVDPDLTPLQAFTSNAEDSTRTPTMNVTNVASTAHPTVGNPVAALFRLSPSSTKQDNPKLWMEQLRSLSFRELMEKAGTKHPNAAVRSIEGVLSGDAGGFNIQQDDELGAYLDCAAALGRVVFAVTLV